MPTDSTPAPQDPRRDPLAEPLVRALAFIALAGAAAWGTTQLVVFFGALGPALVQALGGWTLAVSLEPLVRLLARRIGRGLAALFAVLLSGVALAALLAWAAATIAGPLATWAAEPIGVARWREILGGAAALLDRFDLDIGELLNAADAGLREAVAPIASDLGSLAGEAAAVVGALLGTLIAASIFAAERETVIRLVASVVADAKEARARFAIDGSAEALGRLIRGHAIAGALYALLLLPALSVAGAPEVALVATAAGVLFAIPALGVGLGVLPVLASLAFAPSLVGLLVGVALAVAAWFLAANVVLPRLLAGSIGVPPSAVALAGILGGAIGGLPGALISLPILTTAVALRNALRTDEPGV